MYQMERAHLDIGSLPFSPPEALRTSGSSAWPRALYGHSLLAASEGIFNRVQGCDGGRILLAVTAPVSAVAKKPALESIMMAVSMRPIKHIRQQKSRPPPWMILTERLHRLDSFEEPPLNNHKRVYHFNEKARNNRFAVLKI